MAKRIEDKAISGLDGAKGVPAKDRAGLLLEINNLIVSNLNIPELLKTVSACLHKVVDHDFAVLFIYDEEAKALRAHALHSQLDNVAVEEGYLLPIENSVSGFTFSNKQTLVFGREDLEKFPATLMLTMPHTKNVQSGCSVIDKTGKEMFKVLSFDLNNFENGVALIRDFDSKDSYLYGYINQRGEVLWKPAK